MTSLHMLQDQSFTLKPRVVPIQQVMHAAYDEVRQSAEAKNITVESEFPPRSLLVTADPERLMPALVNIFNNAVKFTDAGKQVTMGAGIENGNIVAWVKDTGIGIPTAELEKIFQEFYQVEDHMTRQFGGLGIGLTIARGLIESQGGRVWAESDGPGKGSTFKVLLPPAGTSSLS
jgi:signal transduction histidine kinase